MANTAVDTTDFVSIDRAPELPVQVLAGRSLDLETFEYVQSKQRKDLRDLGTQFYNFGVAIVHITERHLNPHANFQFLSFIDTITRYGLMVTTLADNLAGHDCEYRFIHLSDMQKTIENICRASRLLVEGAWRTIRISDLLTIRDFVHSSVFMIVDGTQVNFGPFAAEDQEIPLAIIVHVLKEEMEQIAPICTEADGFFIEMPFVREMREAREADEEVYLDDGQQGEEVDESDESFF
ncbi:uncharacterized protein F4822DRAFT_6603 [Hypoxylon trugodes]|uniref:uncharacterized protein n=1 Tax=Hypoxylon trugodes TaxID=326681 RepID=UPI0021A1640C|nr:uncharacterized protein F4822DRAFT_6603 [Hypoxylon trugodes]KAI1393287.1 hypothetical protein F4822DRAFT_6603 [Hypoxylon trugodes]